MKTKNSLLTLQDISYKQGSAYRRASTEFKINLWKDIFLSDSPISGHSPLTLPRAFLIPS